MTHPSPIVEYDIEPVALAVLIVATISVIFIAVYFFVGETKPY